MPRRPEPMTFTLPTGNDPASVRARVVALERIGDVVGAVGRHLEGGQQAYWVCPMVRESETDDIAAAEARYAALAAWAQDKGLGAVATAHHADDQCQRLRALFLDIGQCLRQHLSSRKKLPHFLSLKKSYISFFVVKCRLGVKIWDTQAPEERPNS